MSRWPVKSLKGHISEVSVRKGDMPAEVLSVTNTEGFVRSLEVFVVTGILTEYLLVKHF